MKSLDTFIKNKDNTESEEMIPEMARIGFISSNPILEIYVLTEDTGNVPHFHIRDYVKGGSSGNKFHTCIQYLSNTYFHHNGKEDTLNTAQRKKLVSFLKESYRGRSGYTNWQKLVDGWNDNNLNVMIPEYIKMPDYTTIEHDQ